MYDRKTVLITGTSSGIGRKLVEEFLIQGWNVIATLRNIDDLNLKSKNLLKCHLDVLDQKSIIKAFKEGEERFRTIDVVINNAGSGIIGALEETSLRDYRQQIEVNYLGAIAVAKEAIKIMRPRREGMIVFVGSIAGVSGVPFYSPYCGSKFALDGFVNSFHHEAYINNVRVKEIMPGRVNTSFNNNRIVQQTKIKDYKELAENAQCDIKSLRTSSEVVARRIFNVVEKRSKKVRHFITTDAKLIYLVQRIVSHRFYLFATRRIVYKLKKN